MVMVSIEQDYQTLSEDVYNFDFVLWFEMLGVIPLMIWRLFISPLCQLLRLSLCKFSYLLGSEHEIGGRESAQIFQLK